MREISAGTQPAEHIHPEVVEVIREIGIGLLQKPTEELARIPSVLVTMGCGEICPYIPRLQTVDWAPSDP